MTPSVATPDGRRYWAFLVILGSCFVFTTFAAVGVYLVSGNATYSLYLALAAHLQLFVGMGAFSFVLGRRMRAKGSTTGFEFDDSPDPAQFVADKAQDAADTVKDATP